MNIQRTRIKFCGLTRDGDIDAAVAAGADALGFVFYPKSKRCLSEAQARQLRRRVPAYVTTVALFVNASPEEVAAVQRIFQPDLLQFHGDESPQDCRVHGQAYVKAFRVGGPGCDTAQSLLQSCHAYDDAVGWLFDSYTPQYGGSGHAFDVSLLTAIQADSEARALILSGGMKVQTVTQAIRDVRPWAVDVSSGIESSPGIKCADAMTRFAQAVRLGDDAPR